MLAYTLVLLPVSVAPWALGLAGPIYGVAALVLNLLFTYAAVRVLLDRTLKGAKLMFGYSVFYLFALFLALMIDAA
jgi:protoheme IX farnesyltransferase